MPNFLLSDLKKLPFDFEAEVAKFVQVKKDHLTTEGVPAPTHHQLVELAVRRIPGSEDIPDDFVADYSIVDDTPPPPTLDEKKNALADQINAEAMALINKIDPPLKRKSLRFKINDAFAVPEDERTDAHKTLIAENIARDRKVETIQRHAAELESQIHDLTEDQVDVWKGAPFPTGS